MRVKKFVVFIGETQLLDGSVFKYLTGAITNFGESTGYARFGF
jgi:hypothetical protein